MGVRASSKVVVVVVAVGSGSSGSNAEAFNSIRCLARVCDDAVVDDNVCVYVCV